MRKAQYPRRSEAGEFLALPAGVITPPGTRQQLHDINVSLSQDLYDLGSNWGRDRASLTLFRVASISRAMI